jgi:hypothetical protein
VDVNNELLKYYEQDLEYNVDWNQVLKCVYVDQIWEVAIHQGFTKKLVVIHNHQGHY